MANDDQITARGGLVPVNYPFENIKKNVYRLTTSATASVFLGQPMDLDANGRVVPASMAANNGTILGAVIGFLDLNKAGLPSAMTSLSQGSYLPANTDAYVVISDDPDQEYFIQEDTGGSALVEGNIGNTALITYRSSSGSTVTGWCTAELDRSTVGTGTDNQLVIVGLQDYVNSDGTANAFGNYAKLRVKLTRPRLGQHSLSTAI